MSKKKVVKMKPNRKALKKQSKKAVEAVLRKGPIRRKVKDAPLPGMETVRIPELDNLAGQVADWRVQKNDAASAEKALMPSVLKALKKHQRTFWKAHGVAFTLLTGDEKVAVKLVKDDNDEGGDEPEVEAEDALTADEANA